MWSTKHAFLPLLLILGHFLPNYATAAPYGSGWYGEIQASMGYEDNVARSYKSLDKSDDLIATVAAGGGYTDKVAGNLEYVLTGYLAYNHHDEFSKLSNIATSLGATLVWQPSAAFDGIWYEGSLEVTRLDFDDSEAREGYLLVGGASVNKRFGLKTAARAGYRYADFVFDKSDVEANRDAAFDVANHEIFVGMDRELASNVYLVTEYAFRHGGFTASISGTPKSSYEYQAQTDDGAFQTCTGAVCENWTAYRSVVDVHSIDVGIAWASHLTSYDVSARYYRAKGDTGPSYNDWTVQFGAIWNF